MADVHKELEDGENFSRKVAKKRTNPRTTSRPDHVLKKRRPFGSVRRTDRDVYVTSKTNFQAQLNKCEKLFDAGASEVIIHALGAAVYKACTLALQLQEIHHGTLDLDIKTSTTSLIDDCEPLNDDADYEVSSRNNSAIHIRVFRKVLMGTFKYAQC